MDISARISMTIALVKNAVDLLKSTLSFMPSTAKKMEAERAIVMADEVRRRSDAKLAIKSGGKVCRCQTIPVVMLWSEAEQSDYCPQCQRRELKRRIPQQSSRTKYKYNPYTRRQEPVS